MLIERAVAGHRSNLNRFAVSFAHSCHDNKLDIRHNENTT